MNSSLSTILVADSSKFGLVRSAFVAPLTSVNEIVTDSGISDEWKNIIKDMGIKLHIV